MTMNKNISLGKIFPPTFRLVAMPLVAVLLISLLMSSSSHKTTIYIIGDSTAAEKGNYRNYPERGWGWYSKVASTIRLSLIIMP